jgi:hypothetical protein
MGATLVLTTLLFNFVKLSSGLDAKFQAHTKQQVEVRLLFKSLTPELNPSVQLCLTSYLLGFELFEPSISLIYA